MIAIDTNILVYAHRGESPWHQRAKQAIAELAASGAPWAIPWHCLHEFYATVTHPRRYVPPSTEQQAIKQIDTWLLAPSLSLLSEDLPTWSVLRQLLEGARITGARAYDARIAALCLRHGVTELWTHDRDFSRFPTLRIHDPLVQIQPTSAHEPGARRLGRSRRASTRVRR